MKNDEVKDTVGNPQQTQNAALTNTDAHIYNVNIKVPAFWRTEPALWFVQLEAQFELSRIQSDRVKYNTVISNIDSATLVHVSDIVLNPPQTNKYETVRKRLIENFTDSEQKRLKRLLSEIELGDKRPSQLLREMQNLAPHLDKQIVQQLWLQRLPASIQAILSTSSEDIQKLAEMADKICEITAVPEVNSLQTQRAGAPASQFEILQKQIAELSNRLDKMMRFSRSRSSSRSNKRTPSVNTRTNANQQSSADSMCWYHNKFNSAATKCRSPCSFKEAPKN